MKENRKFFIFAILAVVILIVLHNTNLIVNHDDPANLVKLFGRFHPLLVHFPIVMILITAGLELFSRTRPEDDSLRTLTTWSLGLTALSSFVSVYLGIMLAAGETYDGDLLEWHERFGVLLSVSATLAFLFRATSLSKQSWAPMLSRVLIFLGVIFMAIGADKGGSLTHGADYLTKYLPWNSGDDQIMDYGELSIFESMVQPILNDKCVKCHSGDRIEGGLSLASAETFQEGGDDGEIIVETSPSESELVRRMVLPLDHKRHMPPAGDTQLTPRESEIIKWWIETGASFETPVPENETTEMADLVLEGMGLEDMPTGVFALEVAAADSSDLNAIASATGVLISPLAENVNLLQVATTNVQKTFRSKHIDQFNPVADKITWLDLGGTMVNDSAMASIGKMNLLSKLHLEKTNVSDAGLSHLKGLEYLEYLNLYDTEITDAGLEHIKDLPKLKSLYLWQSKVSKEAADRLRTARPDLEVNMGIDLAPAE